MIRIFKHFKVNSIFILAILSLFCSNLAWADGTETLGPPGIAIESGSGFVGAGTGLSTQPGTININVPAGATVQQVLLYWSGEYTVTSDDEIDVDGNLITGTSIGGPTTFFSNVQFETFRADITDLGLVSAGANILTVQGLNFDVTNSGAGILVIFDDGSSTASIEIRDGQDLAFINFASPLDTTVPQTFIFPAAGADRTAELVIFAGSVGGADRPNEIVITVDGSTTSLINPLGSIDGDFWDTATIPVSIPALATSLTIQVLSAPDGSGNLPASLNWITSALSVEELEIPGTGRFTGGGHQIRVDGVRVTRGLTIHCDLLLSNNLEVNWNGNRFHMTEHLETVSCTDDPNIIQFPPAAPLDTLEGVGTGRFNGVEGYTIEFTLVDAGEPGTEDEAALLIYETADPGNVVLDVPLQLLDGGNLQAHFDQPHR